MVTKMSQRKMDKKQPENVKYIIVHQPQLKQFLVDFPSARWTATSSCNDNHPLIHGYYVNVCDILKHPNCDNMLTFGVFIEPRLLLSTMFK